MHRYRKQVTMDQLVLSADEFAEAEKCRWTWQILICFTCEKLHELPGRKTALFEHSGSWMQDTGSSVLEPGSWIQDTGSTVLDHGSSIRIFKQGCFTPGEATNEKVSKVRV